MRKEDWLGFDKLAKMLGEIPDDDPPKLQDPVEPLPESSAEPETPPGGEDAAPKE